MEGYLALGTLSKLEGRLMVSSTFTVAALAAITTVSLLSLLRTTLYPASLRKKVLKSPLTTILPRMKDEDVQKLVYPPDCFPGARDVETPYGSIRVYEWGPEDGPRVLFLHGISTPCITLGQIAHGLAMRGCRVMLFDLFGRGYSDGVGDLPHDERLYVSEALMAMASSTVSWTGQGALRVIGYSMGGGIAIHLAAAFPQLVSSLVLIAPSGLIRASNFGFSRYLFRSSLVPERILAALTRRRLQRPIASKKALEAATAAAAKEDGKAGRDENIIDVGIAETADPNPDDGIEFAIKLQSSLLGFVRWMVANHEGFISAFMSSVQFAPLAGQEESWRAISRRPKGTTALILGRHDEIIHLDQYTEDALPLVGGAEHVRWKVLPGAHDIPTSHSKECLAEIEELWRAQYLQVSDFRITDRPSQDHTAGIRRPFLDDCTARI